MEKIMTPEELVAFFLDTEARVNDEVARIMQMLKETHPGTARPKYFKFDHFEIEVTDNEKEFNEKVAAIFRSQGWEERFGSDFDISGGHEYLNLKSPELSKLPKMHRRGGLRSGLGSSVLEK